MLLFFCFHFLVLLDIAFMLIISLDSREQTLQMVSCERLALSPLLSYEEAAWAFFFFSLQLLPDCSYMIICYALNGAPLKEERKQKKKFMPQCFTAFFGPVNDIFVNMVPLSFLRCHFAHPAAALSLASLAALILALTRPSILLRFQ